MSDADAAAGIYAPFNGDAVRALAAEWMALGETIAGGVIQMDLAADGAQWVGAAGNEFRNAWPQVRDSALLNNQWCMQIATALYNYADEAEAFEAQVKKAETAFILTLIFGFVLDAVLLPAMGAVFAALDLLIGSLVEVLGIVGDLAIGAITFTARTVVSTAVQLGNDILSQLAADRITHVPFVIDWAGEGFNLGMAALGGGLTAFADGVADLPVPPKLAKALGGGVDLPKSIPHTDPAPNTAHSTSAPGGGAVRIPKFGGNTLHFAVDDVGGTRHVPDAVGDVNLGKSDALTLHGGKADGNFGHDPSFVGAPSNSTPAHGGAIDVVHTREGGDVVAQPHTQGGGTLRDPHRDVTTGVTSDPVAVGGTRAGNDSHTPLGLPERQDPVVTANAAAGHTDRAYAGSVAKGEQVPGESMPGEPVPGRRAGDDTAVPGVVHPADAHQGEPVRSAASWPTKDQQWEGYRQARDADFTDRLNADAFVADHASAVNAHLERGYDVFHAGQKQRQELRDQLMPDGKGRSEGLFASDAHPSDAHGVEVVRQLRDQVGDEYRTGLAKDLVQHMRDGRANDWYESFDRQPHQQVAKAEDLFVRAEVRADQGSVFDRRFAKDVEDFKQGDPLGAHVHDRDSDYRPTYKVDDKTGIVRPEEPDTAFAKFRFEQRDQVMQAVDKAMAETAGRPHWMRELRVSDEVSRVEASHAGALQKFAMRERQVDLSGKQFDEAAGVAKQPLQDKALAKTRDEFLDDVRDAFDATHSRTGHLTDAGAARAWHIRETNLVEGLPERLDHAHFLDTQIQRGHQALETEADRAALHDALMGGDDRLVSVGDLSSDALDRVHTGLDKQIREAVDAHWQELHPGSDFRGRSDSVSSSAPARDAGAVLSWDAHWNGVSDSVPTRLAHERDLVETVHNAARDFNRLTGPEGNKFRVAAPDKRIAALGDDFRGETVKAHDRIFTGGWHDTAEWLKHEAAHENDFDAAFDRLQRQEPDAYRVEQLKDLLELRDGRDPQAGTGKGTAPVHSDKAVDAAHDTSKQPHDAGDRSSAGGTPHQDRSDVGVAGNAGREGAHGQARTHEPGTDEPGVHQQIQVQEQLKAPEPVRAQAKAHDPASAKAPRSQAHEDPVRGDQAHQDQAHLRDDASSSRARQYQQELADGLRRRDEADHALKLAGTQQNIEQLHDSVGRLRQQLEYALAHAMRLESHGASFQDVTIAADRADRIGRTLREQEAALRGQLGTLDSLNGVRAGSVLHQVLEPNRDLADVARHGFPEGWKDRIHAPLDTQAQEQLLELKQLPDQQLHQTLVQSQQLLRQHSPMVVAGHPQTDARLTHDDPLRDLRTAGWLSVAHALHHGGETSAVSLAQEIAHRNALVAQTLAQDFAPHWDALRQSPAADEALAQARATMHDELGLDVNLDAGKAFRGLSDLQRIAARLAHFHAEGGPVESGGALARQLLPFDHAKLTEDLDARVRESLTPDQQHKELADFREDQAMRVRWAASAQLETQVHQERIDRLYSDYQDVRAVQLLLESESPHRTGTVDDVSARSAEGADTVEQLRVRVLAHRQHDRQLQEAGRDVARLELLIRAEQESLDHAWHRLDFAQDGLEESRRLQNAATVRPPQVIDFAAAAVAAAQYMEQWDELRRSEAAAELLGRAEELLYEELEVRARADIAQDFSGLDAAQRLVARLAYALAEGTDLPEAALVDSVLPFERSRIEAAREHLFAAEAALHESLSTEPLERQPVQGLSEEEQKLAEAHARLWRLHEEQRADLRLSGSSTRTFDDAESTETDAADVEALRERLLTRQHRAEELTRTAEVIERLEYSIALERRFAAMTHRGAVAEDDAYAAFPRDVHGRFTENHDSETRLKLYELMLHAPGDSVQAKDLLRKAKTLAAGVQLPDVAAPHTAVGREMNEAYRLVRPAFVVALAHTLAFGDDQQLREQVQEVAAEWGALGRSLAHRFDAEWQQFAAAEGAQEALQTATELAEEWGVPVHLPELHADFDTLTPPEQMVARMAFQLHLNRDTDDVARVFDAQLPFDPQHEQDWSATVTEHRPGPDERFLQRTLDETRVRLSEERAKEWQLASTQKDFQQKPAETARRAQELEWKIGDHESRLSELRNHSEVQRLVADADSLDTQTRRGLYTTLLHTPAEELAVLVRRANRILDDEAVLPQLKVAGPPAQVRWQADFRAKRGAAVAAVLTALRQGEEAAREVARALDEQVGELGRSLLVDRWFEPAWQEFQAAEGAAATLDEAEALVAATVGSALRPELGTEFQKLFHPQRLVARVAVHLHAGADREQAATLIATLLPFEVKQLADLQASYAEGARQRDEQAKDTAASQRRLDRLHRQLEQEQAQHWHEAAEASAHELPPPPRRTAVLDEVVELEHRLRQQPDPRQPEDLLLPTPLRVALLSHPDAKVSAHTRDLLDLPPEQLRPLLNDAHAQLRDADLPQVRAVRTSAQAAAQERFDLVRTLALVEVAHTLHTDGVAASQQLTRELADEWGHLGRAVAEDDAFSRDWSSVVRAEGFDESLDAARDWAANRLGPMPFPDTRQDFAMLGEPTRFVARAAYLLHHGAGEEELAALHDSVLPFDAQTLTRLRAATPATRTTGTEFADRFVSALVAHAKDTAQQADARFAESQKQVQHLQALFEQAQVGAWQRHASGARRAELEHELRPFLTKQRNRLNAEIADLSRPTQQRLNARQHLEAVDQAVRDKRERSRQADAQAEARLNELRSALQRAIARRDTEAAELFGAGHIPRTEVLEPLRPWLFHTRFASGESLGDAFPEEYDEGSAQRLRQLQELPEDVFRSALKLSADMLRNGSRLPVIETPLTRGEVAVEDGLRIGRKAIWIAATHRLVNQGIDAAQEFVEEIDTEYSALGRSLDPDARFGAHWAEAVREPDFAEVLDTARAFVVSTVGPVGLPDTERSFANLGAPEQVVARVAYLLHERGPDQEQIDQLLAATAPLPRGTAAGSAAQTQQPTRAGQEKGKQKDVGTAGHEEPDVQLGDAAEPMQRDESADWPVWSYADPELAARERPEDWRTASQLVQWWDHFDFADSTRDETRQQFPADVLEVMNYLVQYGYQRAEQAAKDLGELRGVRPWAGRTGAGVSGQYLGEDRWEIPGAGPSGLRASDLDETFTGPAGEAADGETYEATTDESGSPHSYESLVGGDAEHTQSTAIAEPRRRVTFAPDPVREPSGGTGDLGHLIDDDLDRRRPTRVLHDIVPPSREQGPVEFTDGARLPAYFNGVAAVHPKGAESGLEGGSYGHSRVTLRSVDKVVRELGWRLSGLAPFERGPGGLLSRVEHALRTEPDAFTGKEGREFSYLDVHGHLQWLRIATRHYGKWEQFLDSTGAVGRYPSAHRMYRTTGGSETTESGAQLSAGTGLGPAGPLSGFGRVSARIGRVVGNTFTLISQLMSGSETRAQGKSHTYTDDIYFKVTPMAGDDPTDGFAFGVRNGLMLRITQGMTEPQEPGRAPREIELGPESNVRLPRTEGFGPVDAIREWATGKAGAGPGSSAFATVAGFFSSRNMTRNAAAVSQGSLPGPPLFAEDGTPLGSFVVEGAVPERAFLVDETKEMEMRAFVEATEHDERAYFKALSAGISGSLGPSFTLPGFFGHAAGLRLQAALSLDYGFGSQRTVHLGGNGTVKTLGQAGGFVIGKQPTDLYLVQKTVHVRWTGDEKAKEFRTWSLDRLTRDEARRLAGWDDGSSLPVRSGAEPAPAPYLTKDHPRTLGMSRVEEFTFEDGSKTHSVNGRSRTALQEFSDQVLAAVADRYPGMVARVEHLRPPKASRQAESHGPEQPKWRDLDQYRMALDNTQTILTALSHASVAQNLQTMTTVGMPVTLKEQGRFRTHHRQVWLSAELTDRQYKGTTAHGERWIRNYLGGAQQMGQESSTSRAFQGALDLYLSVRDAALSAITKSPNNTGTAQFGARLTRRTGRSTATGATLYNEPMGSPRGPAHLHSYKLSLTAHAGGYGRIRGVLRFLSLGALGTRPLISREPQAELVGGETGEPFTARVLLAVPAAHSPDHASQTAGAVAAREWMTPASNTRGAIRTESMSTSEARALADGTVDALVQPGEHERLQLEPVQTVAVLSDEVLPEAAERIMGRASGGAQSLTQHGFPAHDSMLRSFHPTYWAAHFDQNSAPLGSHVSGLHGRGPYQDNHAAMVVRTRLENPVVLGDAVQIYNEQTIAADVELSASRSNTSQISFGGVGTFGHFDDLGRTVTGSYSGLFRHITAQSFSRAVSRTVNQASTMNWDNYHQFLIGADVRVDMAAKAKWTAAFGLLGSHLLGGNAPVGQRLVLPAGYLGHVPEPSAYRLGLVQDGLPAAPEFKERAWVLPPWLRDNIFGSHPINALDTSDLQTEILPQLRRLGFDEADLALVRTALTPRATRALLTEMSGVGVTVTARGSVMHQWGVTIGGRELSVRLELIPGEQRLKQLQHAIDLEDYRNVTQTTAMSRARSRRLDVGFGTSQAVSIEQDNVGSDGPILNTSGYSSQQLAESNVETRTTFAFVFGYRGHAEYAIDYRMKLTVEAGDAERLAHADRKVGSLRQVLPLSLASPVTTGVHKLLQAPRPPLPEARQLVWPIPRMTDEEVTRWRRGGSPDSDSEPPVLTDLTFQVRWIAGLANIHDAGVLAIGGAYSSRRRASGELSGRQLEGALREARGTALTRQGTMAAQALTNGVGGAALAGFYRDTLAPEGYEVPGLATEDFIGGANADYRLFSRPDFKTATLLTVDPKALLWSIDQVGHQTRTGLTSTSGDETVLSTSPVILNDALGAAVPSLGDLPLAEMSASEARTNAYLEIERRGMWPEQSRLMLFWIPTRWLSIAGVHHLVSDSALGKRVRGTFGDITTAPVAAETDAPVVAWVDEHKARELGLINDENFPAELGRTWDEAAKATEGWIAAAHAYWDARRPVRHLQAELDAAQAAHDEMLPAEAAEAEAEHAPETDTPPAQLAEAAERLRRARDAYDTAAAAVADHWQAADDAVAELHRVRAAADQLTRWYQLPPARRAEVDRPEDVTYQAPEQQSAPERPTYTVVPADGEAPARLVAPTDETYLLHDVPPRDSFLNALAEGMRHNDPDWVNGLLVDGRGTRSELLDALRGRLVDGISSPANADLAEFIAADEADRFTPEELAQAGIDLGEDTPARREFDALGVMPQVQDLSAEQRAALAEAQLRRADGAGLDSAVADLLPALAARELQLNITVVQADGSFQEFQPHVGADQVPTVVLYLADRHFQLVLAEGSEPGTGLAALPESAPPHKAVTETPGQRPAHTVAPWWSGGEEGRYDTRDHERLTAPDGSVYELQPATGTGNGFFGALSRTLDDTSRARLEHAQQPDDYGTPWLQRAAELDPAAGFHRRDLEAAGVRLTDELWAVHHRNGGRLPEGVKLSDQQRRSLVTSHMLGADGWSATTTERTALQFARWLKIELTLVAENGTVEFSTDGRTPGSDSRSVVLYRRGRDWVAAVPTLAVVAHAHPPLESSAGSVGPGIVSQQPVAAPTMALPRVTERQDTARPQPTVAEPRPAEPQVRASQDQVTTTPPSVVASAAYFGVAPRPETAAPVVDDADLLLHPRPLGGALGRFRQPDLTDVGTQSAEQPVEQAVESTVPKDAVGTGEPQASPMAVQPRSYGAASPQDGVAAQAQAPLTQASVGHSIAAYRAVTQDSEVRRLLDEVAPLVYRVRFTGPGAVETAPRTAAWPARDERPEQGGHTIQAGDGYEISLGRVTHAQDQIATLVHELVHVSVFRQYGRDKNLSANVASDPVVLSRFETYVRMRVVELVNRLPESGLPAGWRLAAQQKLTGHVGMNATLEYDGVLAQLLIWSDQYGDRRSAFHQQLVNLVGETRGWRAAGQVQVPQLPQGSTAHGVERDLMAAASAPVVPSWRLTIPFAEEVRDTVEAGPRAGITALAQDVARTAVSHARHGLPMPAVTVTGMGNGKRYAVPSRAAKAEAAGKDRAAVVAREFRADLADALRANPLGDGSLLDAALVPVTEATVGRNLPADGRNLSAAQLRQLRRQAVIDVTEQPPAVQGAGGAGPVLAGLGAAGPSSEEGTEASASSGQVLRDRTVSAGEEAGSLVTDPAPAESWIHRRADARPGRLTTERFDPATDAAERADAAAARGTWDDVLRQIRAQNPAVQVNSEIRRVQAANGQWVRDFTAVLTVELPAGFTETDLAAYQVRLQGALDEYVNHGYALPRSRDQLHVGVELTPVAENGMVRLTDSGEPRAYQGLWDLGHDLRRIVHEVLHWAVGLHDEYVTETSLFRRDADAPWVRDQGIMASMRPEAAVVFPARYLAEIENVSDSGPVLYDLPLRSGPQRVVTGKPPLLIPGPAAANLNEAMPPASPLSPRSSRSVDPADVAGQRPAAALAMSQQMVPGGRDLELARQLLSGDHATVSEGLRAERQRVEAELSNTMRGLPQGEGEPYLAMLRSRLQRVSQDLEIFGSLSARGIWGDPNQTPPRPSALREAHVTAIVLAERRGRQVAASERRALIDRLRGGRWAWASEYPLGDDEIGPLLDRVHEHVRHRMDVTINMRLDKEIAPGRTVLDSMLEDQGRLFRSAWEAGEQNRGYEARRGATEERMGYAAALNRDRRAGGVFQSLDPDPARDRFAPTSASRTDLPKYAALMSPHRTRALAAYGPSIFHWNPAVRERATFTPQDSFAGGRAGVRGITGADHLFPLLLHGQEDVVRLAFAEATGFAHDAGMRDLRDRGNLSTMAGGYFEAQIHGDLSWSDLERIVLMYETFEKEKFEDIKTRLEEFAAAQGYGFQVEMRRRPIPGRPAPVVEALPVAATGTHGVLSADVHETYPEIELVTSLLDEAGNFPPGLLGESAEAVEAAQAPVAKGGSKGKGKQRDPERLADDADAVIRASLGDAREELDRAEEALTAAERELMRLDNHYGNRDGAVDSAGEPAALSAARAVAEVEEAVREAAEARVRELETQLELHSQAVTQQSTPTPLVVPAAPVTTTTATAAVPLAEESLLEVPALADVAYAHPHHAPSNRRAFTQRGTRAVPGSASAEVSDAEPLGEPVSSSLGEPATATPEQTHQHGEEHGSSASNKASVEAPRADWQPPAQWRLPLQPLNSQRQFPFEELLTAHLSSEEARGLFNDLGTAGSTVAESADGRLQELGRLVAADIAERINAAGLLIAHTELRLELTDPLNAGVLATLTQVVANSLNHRMLMVLAPGTTVEVCPSLRLPAS